MDQHNLAFRCQFSRKDVFDIWLQQKGKNNRTKYQHVLKFIVEQLNTENLSEKVLRRIQTSVSVFCSQLTKRWQISKRSKYGFLAKNINWLNQPYQLPRSITEPADDRNSEYPLLKLSVLDIKHEPDSKKPDTSAEIDYELVLPDSVICRLCLKVADKNFTLLCDSPSLEGLLFQDAKRIQDIKFMIQTCMHTFDLTLSENPVVCNHCLSQLITAYNFFSCCLSNQDRIQRYRDTRAVSKMKVNLPDILLEVSTNQNHSQVNDTMRSSKQEQYFDESVNCHKKFLSQTNEETVEIKSLEIDIKEEPNEVYDFVDYSGDNVKQEINIFDNYESCSNQNLELFSGTNYELKSENSHQYSAKNCDENNLIK